jgi:acyl-CoA synthetase (NDP forming)
MPKDLHGFFYPRTVALIGATDKRGKPGTAILENLAHFRGAVYPVNPKYETLLGHHCYPSLMDVPDALDLAIIALPAALVEQELDAVHRKEIGRAHV